MRNRLIGTVSLDVIQSLVDGVLQLCFAFAQYHAGVIGIGLFGIAASFSAQVLARRKEFGLLTHLGLSRRQVLLRHVLPNAFAPTWTMIGLVLGGLLGGIAVLETVFTLPGLGRLLVDAIFARDYPVVQGCLLFTALIYVLVNLIVDLCYPLFDPRVAAS